MAMTEKDASVHRVKIQQTYRMKDTSEERILETGAIRSGKVVEQVEYYDTDLYTLAMKETWLSKIGSKWHLIVGKGGPEMADTPSKNNCSQSNSSKTGTTKTQSFNPTNTKTHSGPTTWNSPSESKRVPAADINGNTEPLDGNSRSSLTCYALGDQTAIIAYLCRVLHITGEAKNMDDVLRKAKIQRYASNTYSTQEDFLVRDIYHVQVKADGAMEQKTAVISLEVDIENVTQGFQRLEQLANELDLQVQCD